MARLLTLTLCILGTLAVAHCTQVRYDGYKVVRVVPQKQEHLLALKSLEGMHSGTGNIDFWIPPRQVGVPVDICLCPALFDLLYSAFKLWGVYPVVIIQDVQQKIDAQRNVPRNPLLKKAELDYSAYHKLDDIVDWMKNITTVHNGISSLFTIATSYEKRAMQAIKIHSTNGPQPKPAIWIEGGIHAREWISPATVIYMAGQMLDNYGKVDNITELVDAYDWYILPVFNVDGYEYTWTDARMWRKTRSKHGNCFGADPNRNWDWHWCEVGASDQPCSDTYCGPSPFSEVEVKGVADYIKTINNVKGFIDFHSYSQLWMTPWGYTKDLPSDYAQINAGAAAACDALTAVYGTKYQHGSIANIIYEASGSSADWTYGDPKIKYSYGVELRDKGQHGFLLPADQIIPSGQETLASLIALAKYITNNP